MTFFLRGAQIHVLETSNRNWYTIGLYSIVFIYNIFRCGKYLTKYKEK
jgi:hypothetical protein